MKRGFFQILISVSLFACQFSPKENNSVIEVSNKIPKEGVILNNWQVIGPFKTPDNVNGIQIDNFEKLGLSENELNPSLIKMIPDSIVNDSSLTNNSFRIATIETGVLPLETVGDNYKEFEDAYGNFYLTCTINSREDKNTMLHLATNTRKKVWLNNELICFDDFALPAWSYQTYLPISLKKGENSLVLKVNKTDKMFEVYARLENFSDFGYRRLYESRNEAFLQDCILEYTNSLSFNPVFPPFTGTIKINDYNEHEVHKDSISESENWKMDVSMLADGYYEAELKTNDVVIMQGFYKGNLIDSTASIINSINLIPKSEKSRQNIEPLVFRYNHLLKQSWVDHKKLVQIFKSLNDIHAKLLEGVSPFQHTSGRFIRSYVSKIDSSTQHYQLHVPASYDKNKSMPVMVVIPTNAEKNPYLESWRLGNYNLMNIFQSLAEKFNMIVIQPGSRHFDQAVHNSVEEAEVFDILDQVSGDYQIDRNKIYLSSACSGGNDVLKLVAKYPDYFAAIGLVSPSINYGIQENPWLKYHYPAVYFSKNLKHLPLLIIHSTLDRHVPIATSDFFNSIAIQCDFEHFNYLKLYDEFQFYYTDQHFEKIFDFCSDKSLDPSPSKINFTTSLMLYNKSFWITINEMNLSDEAHIKAEIKNNKLTIEKENITGYTIDLSTLPYDKNKVLKIEENGKLIFKDITKESELFFGLDQKERALKKNSRVAGPLADVFSRNFILVKGTIGNEKEVEGIQAIAETFSERWRERFLVDCIIKTDKEITDEDITSSNLVLLGNAKSNLLFEKWENQIPISVTDSMVTINKKEFVRGHKLCYYLTYPNPENNNLYIAVIGYNNPNFISLGGEIGSELSDVTNYGWYDYKIWNDFPFNYEKLNGYFDSNWDTP